MKTSLSIAAISFALIASGCAGYMPSRDAIGQSRATLLAEMGPPEREQSWQGFQRLHYPRGPAGRHTYFVDLDSEGRVVGWEQVLTVERFNAVKPGMTRDQVIDLLGIAKTTNGLARNRGYVWHYRYDNPHCTSFMIEFTQEDVVRGAGFRTRSGRQCHYVGPG